MSGQRGREVILIDDEAISATGAKDWKGIPQHWSRNIRFQALVSGAVPGSNPRIVIDIEHYLISSDAVNKLGTMVINGDGAFPLYTEELETQFPFPMIRANVIEVSDLTATIRLVGSGDKEN